MTIHLSILNASGQLSEYQSRIGQCFASSIDAIRMLLPVSRIDVAVIAGKRVIPELGLGAVSPDRHHVFVTCDPDNRNLAKCFDAEFRAALGHEMHHCMRHGGPGYGTTLREAMVSEGLACQFETELREGGTVPFYAANVTQSELDKLTPRMLAELDNPAYDHRAWFFGSTEKNIPRYAGYSLGYQIVANYVVQSGTPASRLWDIDAKRIFP